MDKIFISIIVPVYNVEKYLRECLDSISQLKTVTWEAILVDDGSTDTSGKICDEYAKQDSRFRVIHQKNAGVSAARNAGLDAAKGEWIWFVDSDDIVDTQCVPNTKNWLDNQGDIDYVMFSLKKFEDGDKISVLLKGTDNNTPNIIKEDNKNVFQLKYLCSQHQQLWYKREIIESHYVRFTLGIRNSEDGEFMAKYLMLMRNPIKVDSTIYYYRMREGSAMHLASSGKNIIEDVPVVFFNLLKWMGDVGQPVEPWLNFWFLKMIQNLLVQAGRYQQLNKRQFQATIRKMIDTCDKKGFSFVRDKKMRLAYFSISAYFIVNKLYMKIKGL